LNATADAFAEAFAQKGYNYGTPIKPHGIISFTGSSIRPASGHWMNNPHADCIDFQIEADFAGLMSPGMPLAANENLVTVSVIS
jgi:hypothetical protein